MNVTGVPTRLTDQDAIASPQSPPRPPSKTVTRPATLDIRASRNDDITAPVTVTKNAFTMLMRHLPNRSRTEITPRRKINAKLPSPKHLAMRKCPHLMPSFPAELCAFTLSLIMSGSSRRL